VANWTCGLAVLSPLSMHALGPNEAPQGPLIAPIVEADIGTSGIIRRAIDEQGDVNKRVCLVEPTPQQWHIDEVAATGNYDSHHHASYWMPSNSGHCLASVRASLKFL